MDASARSLQELMDDLTPEMLAEVRDFAEFLLTRHRRQPGQALRQDWAGALHEYRQQYTSLELQHQALEWRGD